MKVSLKTLKTKKWYRITKVILLTLLLISSVFIVLTAIDKGKSSTLRMAINIAKSEPESERSKMLLNAIKVGKMDKMAAEEGIDISKLSPTFEVSTMNNKTQNELFKYDLYKIIPYIFFGFIIEILIWEFIKRSLYYIFTGKIFPKD